MTANDVPDKPATDWVGGITVATMFVGGITVGIAIAPEWEIGGTLGMAFACVFILSCVRVHEYGHAVGAWIAGWRVHAICVGRRAYFPVTGRRHAISLLLVGERGGWTLATPVDGDWEKGRALFCAGGPLANLLAALLAIALALAIPGSWLAAVLEGFAASSAVVGLLNLVPFRRPGRLGSDGAILIDIAQGKKQDALTGDLTLLFGAYFDGVAPKDWDAEVVRRVEEAAPRTPRDRGREVVLVMRYLSQGAFRRAYEFLELANYNKTMATLVLHHAYLVALVTRDGRRARDMLNSVHPDLHDMTSLYRRAEAMVLALEEKRAEARSATLVWRKLAERYGESLDMHEESLLAAIARGETVPFVDERRAEAA